MVSLAFGEHYEAGIDSSGQLYVWDVREVDSNLDANNQDNSRANITKLHKDVKQVKFTGGYIWALTKSGQVYQYPIIKKFDQNNRVIEKKIGSKR